MRNMRTKLTVLCVHARILANAEMFVLGHRRNACSFRQNFVCSTPRPKKIFCITPRHAINLGNRVFLSDIPSENMLKPYEGH